jgi:phospholipid/cholesterol/gamma-HCH transport system ATP-binding protein
MSKPILQVRNLSTQFGKLVIHKKINLDVYEGEILGIVGGSGTGKSVLLRFMIGLEPPQKGEITYPASPPPAIGVLFQKGALMSSLTVLENIMIPLREMAHLSAALSKEIALLKLKLVGLKESDGFKMPAQLSGGMVKRVGLARALALDPPLVFLDEPTSGLDPVSAGEFDDLILSLQQSLGLTFVMVTHDLDSIVTTCNRLAVLADKSIHVGTPQEMAEVDHPWFREYFKGSRGRRFFPASPAS